MTDHRYTPTVPSPTADNVYRVVNYGTVDKTGAVDSSAAVIAAIAACSAGGGGWILFPATPGTGAIRIDSQLVIPNDGLTHPTQQPIVFVGEGAWFDGLEQQQNPLSGGTVLDLRSTTGPAKIDTRGAGALDLRAMTLTQRGSAADTNPFIQTTNTTIFPHDLAIYGHSTLTGAACIQDAIVLGGTTVTIDGSATAAFQGYGTSIEKVYFARIRRGIYGRVFCNAAHVRACTWSLTCGSDNTAAAIQIDGTVGFAKGNTVTDCLIEVTGYVYGIRLTNSGVNWFSGNSWWDNTGTFGACYLLEGAAANTGANAIRDTFTGPPSSKWILDNTTGGPASVSLTSGVTHLATDLAGGDQKNRVRPLFATANEAALLFQVKRSAAEATNPDVQIFGVQQGGAAFVGSSSSTVAGITIQNAVNGTLTIDNQSIVKNTGNILVFAGADQPYRKMSMQRGLFQIASFTTAGRPSAVSGGAGSMCYDTTLGIPIWSDGAVWRNAIGVAV